MNICRNVINCDFNNLPDEIVVKVFDYLPYSDLKSCSKVSNRFRRIVADSSLFLGKEKYNLLCGIFERFAGLSQKKKLLIEFLKKIL